METSVSVRTEGPVQWNLEGASVRLGETPGRGPSAVNSQQMRVSVGTGLSRQEVCLSNGHDQQDA